MCGIHSQTDPLVVALIAAAGLHVETVGYRMGRLVRRVLKGILSANRLGFAVIEVALRVDMQPASCLIVLVAFDVACLPLPLVPGCFIGHSRFDGGIMPRIDFCFMVDDFGQ